MNEESTQRITNTTAVFMVTVALLFDLAQIVSKILTLLGLTVLTGALGVMLCNYVNINAPTSCAIVGAGIGAVASFTGIGTAIALKVGMAMSWLADAVLAAVGYATLHFWFHLKGVSVFSGKTAGKKLTMSVVTWLVGFLPWLGTLPDLTVWTATMIYHSRGEDKERAKEAEKSYNEKKNLTRMTRRYIRPTHADA
jgi:hypothetical protein